MKKKKTELVSIKSMRITMMEHSKDILFEFNYPPEKKKERKKKDHMWYRKTSCY